MKNLLLFFVAIILITNNLFSQTEEDIVEKIDLKLKFDKKYLNIKAINFLQTDIMFEEILSLPKKAEGEVSEQ